LAKIGRLKDGCIAHPNGDQMKAQRDYIGKVLSAREIYGVSSVNMVGYAEMISHALANGAKVSLVLSQAVIETLSPGQIDKWSASGKFSLKIADNQAAFTVADDALLLGLYRDGKIDPFQEWVVIGPNAREWGLELFHSF
jgi:predicted transcriptional regulator